MQGPEKLVGVSGTEAPGRCICNVAGKLYRDEFELFRRFRWAGRQGLIRKLAGLLFHFFRTLSRLLSGLVDALFYGLLGSATRLLRG